MTRLHFQAHNIQTAIDVCNSLRNRYGLSFRVEAGHIITVFEPNFRVDEVLAKFHAANGN